MDDGHLAELYRNRFPEEELVRKNDIWRVICAKFFQKFVAPTDTVVDVACGYGEFINNIAAGEKIGVDLNPDSEKHLAGDVRFIPTSAAEISSQLKGQANVVFTSNFLEHLPDKHALEELLDEILLTLKPGGRYIVMGPICATCRVSTGISATNTWA